MPTTPPGPDDRPHPASTALVRCGTSAKEALAGFAAAAHVFKTLGSYVAFHGGVASMFRTAFEGALALEDYRLAAANLGLSRRRASEILLEAQGLHAGSSPTAADLVEAHRRATDEAVRDAGFRCTGTATLITGAGTILLTDVDLREDAHRGYGLSICTLEQVLADRRSWGGTATVEPEHVGRLLLECLDGPLTLRLTDGNEAQALIRGPLPDPHTGAYRITIVGVGRPPQTPEA
ncbi:hypothetical protein [Kitasatospora sp. NPDC004272]